MVKIGAVYYWVFRVAPKSLAGGVLRATKITRTLGMFHWMCLEMTNQVVETIFHDHLNIHVASRRQPPAPHCWAHTAGA